MYFLLGWMCSSSSRKKEVEHKVGLSSIICLCLAPSPLLLAFCTAARRSLYTYAPLTLVL